MTLTQTAILAALGLVSGFFNVLAGGGSLLILPALIFMGFSGSVANGTNRIGILAQNVFATAGFMRQGYSDWRLSTSLACATLPGALIGAYAGTAFEGVWFNRLLALLMVTIIFVTARRGRGSEEKPGIREDQSLSPPELRLVRRSLLGEGGTLNPFSPSDPTDGSSPAARLKPEAVATRRGLVRAHLWMIAIGFYGGFIQAGIGFVLMAVLYRGLHLDLVRVNMHKVFIVGILTVAAVLVFAAHGKIDWPAAVVLASGNALGGWLGAHVAVRHGERLIRFALNAALVIMAVKLVFTH